MSKVYLEDSTLTAIGNAIRGKTGESGLLLPSEMANAITNIPSGGGSSELIFKNAFITLSSSAKAINLSPWITDANVNDWFLYGGLPYWSFLDVASTTVAVQPYGPLFRNIVKDTGASAGDWIKGFTIASNGAPWPTNPTASDTKCWIGGGMGVRITGWNATTKVLSFPETKWVSKQQMILFYREV